VIGSGFFDRRCSAPGGQGLLDEGDGPRFQSSLPFLSVECICISFRFEAACIYLWIAVNGVFVTCNNDRWWIGVVVH